MAQDYTTTELLASVKRRGMIAASNESFSNADLLALADEELQSYVVPLLMSVREEYFVALEDTVVTSGTAAYAMPERAIGMKLRGVQYSTDGTNFTELTRILPEEVDEFAATGDTAAFFLRGTDVILVPAPTNSTDTLRLQFFRRPGKLVASTAVATISSIDGTRKIITTTATIPSTFTSGVVVDVVNEKPGFELLVQDSTTTGTVSGTTITLVTALPSTVTAGDYVCLAGESVIPQIPVELIPLLAQRTMFKVLEAIGDPKAVVAKQVADDMAKTALGILTPRADANKTLVRNWSAPGMRYSRYRWRF